ncbi:MAG: hypothetical protein VZS44_03870 [Bacilli bacterium]|nr:hypothetical protein [Bacilli bacterium]
MVINVTNKLKDKIINNKNISKEEAVRFINYMINKTKIIVDRMYVKDYNYMFLFDEIAFSYNLSISYIDSDTVIINVGGFYYLVDMNFDDKRFEELYKKKYIIFNEDNYLKYMRLCGDKNE